MRLKFRMSRFALEEAILRAARNQRARRGDTLRTMEQLWVGRGRDGVLILQKTDSEFMLVSASVHGITRGPIADLSSTLEKAKCGELVEAKLRSGEHHWRIWRTGAPRPNALGDEQRAIWLSTVRAARMIYDRMNTLFAAVEPHPSQKDTFGFLQREIIVLACTEVESAWRSVLSAHATPMDPTSKRWSTKDYVRLLKPMRLDEWTVSLSIHRDFGSFSPFKGWDEDKPTQSLPWYDAYNAVKHGREDSLQTATLGNVVNAMAAAFIMTVAQFGFSHIHGTGLFSQASIFHPDAFQVIKSPEWSPTEVYIKPTKDGLVRGAWLGHEDWTPVPCAM